MITLERLYGTHPEVFYHFFPNNKTISPLATRLAASERLETGFPFFSLLQVKPGNLVTRRKREKETYLALLWAERGIDGCVTVACVQMLHLLQHTRCPYCLN